MQNAWLDGDHDNDESLTENFDDDDDDDNANICRELGLTANAIFIQRERNHIRLQMTLTRALELIMLMM